MANTIKDIDSIDLVVSSEFELDSIILQYGELSYKSQSVINRIFYEVIEYPNDFERRQIEEKEYNVNPKHNLYFYNNEIEGRYSTLNFSEFEKDFCLDEWSYTFQALMIEQMLPDVLTSVNIIFTSLESDKKLIKFFQDLLQLIDGSTYFLKWVVQNSEKFKKIQVLVCTSLLDFNIQLFGELKLNYQKVFSELFENVENTKQIEIGREDSKKSDLRKTNIYKIAILFADGTVEISGMNCIYKKTTYKNINELSGIIANDIEISKKSLQPYLNQTIKNVDNTDKNLFHFSKLKYLQLIADDFHSQNRELHTFFSDKLRYISSISQEV
jgi:hypothetical protein